MTCVRKELVGLFMLIGLFGAAIVPSAQEARPPLSVFAVLYSRGSAWTTDEAAFTHPSIKGHVQHFQSLGDRLIGAAPFVFEPAEPAVGMVVLVAENAAAAREWAAADPAVVAKVMSVKTHQWRVSGVRGFPLRL